MNNLKFRKVFVKILALFTVIRGYNILMLILAQYMASLFIFNVEKNHIQILLDKNLNYIILSSALSIAAGYIVNNFYDLEKDAIQRPLRNYIERFVSQNFKLTIYLILNLFALVIAFMVSWNVFLFFLIYQILVWFYSHKANRMVWLNNLYSVSLMVFPFFALFLYYENFSKIIFFHAGFLFALLLIIDVLKDLTTTVADSIYGYQTLPIVYGEKKTKYVLTVLILFAVFLSFYMWNSSATGYMRYFFLMSAGFMSLSLYPLHRTNSKTTYKIMYFLYKLLIGIGVMNMVFIDLNPLTLQNIF